MIIPKLNKDWHQQHRMPAKASKDQKMQWHREHVKHCGCRPIPATIADEVNKRPPPKQDSPAAAKRLRSLKEHAAGRYKADENLIAPCGMYCALCSGYLAHVHNIPRIQGKIAHCMGCRPRNKQCAHLKGRCFLIRSNRVKYCFECPTFPCEQLRHTDERYRRCFGASPIDNLRDIKEHGEKAFLENQHARFGCRKCGKLRSVHSGKCFACDTVNSWKD